MSIFLKTMPLTKPAVHFIIFSMTILKKKIFKLKAFTNSSIEGKPDIDSNNSSLDTPSAPKKSLKDLILIVSTGFKHNKQMYEGCLKSNGTV